MTLLSSSLMLITQIGIEPLILSRARFSKKNTDMIWTLGLILNSIAGLILVELACTINLSSDSRIVLVGSALSITAWSAGTVSRALLNKWGKFYYLFVAGTLGTLMNLITAVLLASVFNNGSLALISGQAMAGWISAITVIKLCKYKPSLRKPNKIDKEIYVFLRNTSLSSFTNFLSRNIDTALISLGLGVTFLGYYDRAYMLIFNLQLALSQIFSRVFLPKLVKNRVAIAIEYVENLKIYNLFSLLFFLPLLVAPNFIVEIILGSKYSQTARILSTLAVAGFFQAITSMAGLLYIATNATSKQIRVSLISSIVYSSSFLFVYFFHNSLQSFALANVVAAFVMFFVVIFYIARLDIGLTVLDQVKVAAPYLIIFMLVGVTLNSTW